MFEYDPEKRAKVLYAEGWRAADVDELMDELMAHEGMNLIAAEDVAYYLQKIEDAEDAAEEAEEEEADP